MKYTIIVIGTSAGGLDVLKILLSGLRNPNKLPILILQHTSPSNENYLTTILSDISGLPAYEVEDKMPIRDGCIYTPAANYHMLMEKDWTLSLSVEPRVAYARPSIDVLFETVADACKDRTIGILLTGANHDGANGMKVIKDKGGYTIIQDPKDAYAKEMPEAALARISPDYLGSIYEIKNKLEQIVS